MIDSPKTAAATETKTPVATAEQNPEQKNSAQSSERKQDTVTPARPTPTTADKK